MIDNIKSMKKLLIPVISLIANAYFILVWMYVYNVLDTHQERVNAFLRYIPKCFSVGSLSILLILLTMISVIIIAKGNLKSWIKALLFFVQGLFTCFLLWQLL